MPITITSCTAGCVVDRLLDHLRIDVEAAGDDHVLLAVDQVEIAVGIHIADVAGEEAVADEGLGGFLRPVPVALGDVRARECGSRRPRRRQAPWPDRPAPRRPARCPAASARSSPACPAPPADARCRASRSRSCPSRSSACMPGLALEDPRHLDRQRRAAGAGGDQRRQVAACPASGSLASAIHIVGTPGNEVARLSSMSRSTASTSKR